jgi:hypothetical protein
MLTGPYSALFFFFKNHLELLLLTCAPWWV